MATIVRFETLYVVLAQAALAGFLLLALGSAAVLLVREPARRIRVIEWTLVGLLIVPVLGLLPGYPRWAVLPTFEGVTEAIAEAPRAEPTAVETPIMRVDAELPSLIPMETPVGPVEMPEVEPMPASSEIRFQEVPIVGPAPEANTSLAPQTIVAPAAPSEEPQPATLGPAAILTAPPEPDWNFPTDFRVWIVGAYAVGVGAMLVWSLLGLIAVKRLLRSARPADGACRQMLRQIAGPASDRVALVVSSRAGQPCALAWRPTVIVLSESLLAEDDPRRLRWVLAHEWSHVERGDVWSWSLGGLVRWFYFYQPLLWWLRRQLQLCQDYVADAAAARAGALAGAAAEDYAEFLTRVSSNFSRPTLAAGLGIGGRTSDLERRVVMLVENRRPLESASPRRWNLFVLPIAILLVGGVACLGQKPTGEPKKPKESPSSVPTDTKGEVVGPVAEESPSLVPTDATGEPVGPVADPERPVPILADYQTQEKKDLAVRIAEDWLTEFKSQLSREIGKSNDPESSEEIKALRQKIEQFEKILAVCKAGLTPHMVEILNAKDTAAKPERPARIAADLVESEIDKDPTVRMMTARLAEWKERLQTEIGTSANPNELKAVRALRQAIEQQEEDLAERRAASQPRLIEILTAKGPTIQATPAAQPKGPRLIAPGDVLAVDVVTNAEQLSGGAVSLLLRPTTNVTVDAEGKISLGSAYGKTELGGKPLDEAQQLLMEKLEIHMASLIDRAGKDDPELYKKFRHVKPMINVRLTFVNPPGTAVATYPSVQIPGSAVVGTLDSKTGSQPDRIAAGDMLTVKILHSTGTPIQGNLVTDKDGNLPLGAKFGRVNVAGKTPLEAEQAIEKHLAGLLKEPKVQIQETAHAPQNVQTFAPGPQQTKSDFTPTKKPPAPEGPQRIAPGDALQIVVEPREVDLNRTIVVESDGNLPLGPRYGRVNVGGKTLVEAEAAIVEKLHDQVREPEVQVTFARDEIDAGAVKKLEQEILELKKMLRAPKGRAERSSIGPTVSPYLNLLQPADTSGSTDSSYKRMVGPQR